MYNYKDDQIKIIEVVDENPTCTWKELAIILNTAFDDEAGEEAWIKRVSRARNTLAVRQIKEGNFEIERLLHRERQYLRYERSKNYEDIRSLTLRSMMVDEVKASISKTLPPVEPIKLPPSGRDEYIFVTSDFHYDGDETLLLVFNKVYSHIIAKQKELGFSKIKLIELGDIIDGGALRVSQLMAIKKGMVSQIIDVAKAYSNFIHKLSQQMFVDFYCVTSSNHTQLRPLGTKQNELIEEDLMEVFAEYVSLAISHNPNILMHAAPDLVVELPGRCNMFVAHGHLVNKKPGYLQEMAYIKGFVLDYGLFGHYHHYREITLYDGHSHNRKVFYAPSMSITEQSSYERDRNLSSKPAIIMMVFNTERGHRYCEELFI